MIWVTILSCATIFLPFSILHIVDYMKIKQFYVWNKSCSKEEYDGVEETFIAVVFVYGFILLFVDIISLAILSPFYFYLRIRYYKVYIPILIFVILNIIYLIKTRRKDDYKNYHRMNSLIQKEYSIKTSIECFRQRICTIRKDNVYTKEQRDEEIASLEEVIEMLEKIYIEISNSKSTILVNDAIDDVKDLEMNVSNIDSLQRKLDEFESYKSLSEISGELKSLMKKYDKK